MWAEKKRKWPHEWLEGVLGVLGLAPSTCMYLINQNVIKGYVSIQKFTTYLMNDVNLFIQCHLMICIIVINLCKFCVILNAKFSVFV